MNMNIKQTKTNKNKILKLFLIFVFIFGISFPVNAAPTQLHPEGNPEKQTTFQIQANCTEGEALSYTLIWKKPLELSEASTRVFKYHKFRRHQCIAFDQRLLLYISNLVRLYPLLQ